MQKQKRVIAINDISSFGKCSLTVAISILGAAGLETCAVPTAVLSAHTGFKGYTFCDLTENILPSANHWQSMGLLFDGIYSGYLGSKEQVKCVEKVMDMFDVDIKLVDPVMGDDGVLYDGFDESFPAEMKKLVKRADVIVPNVTESCLLTGVPYKEEHSKEYIGLLINELQKICDASIVITGINSKEDKISTVICENGTITYIENQKQKAVYSGTGDVFASTFMAALMGGQDTVSAAKLSAEFVGECIEITREVSSERHYGINFELNTKSLLKKLNII
ncbi:MAG: pyridoxamine kinase [Clostridia bacterium]|nr:pyridoxamine kinase [Clostridia bacterium]